METPKMSRPHWYLVTIQTCPNCYRTIEFRERKYTTRPKSWKARHVITEAYCGCSDYGIDTYAGGFSNA